MGKVTGCHSRIVAVISFSELAILTLEVTKRCGYQRVANLVGLSVESRA